MIIYNYDGSTGEYLSSSSANLDELESKIQGRAIYTIPSNATEIIPPKAANGYVCCFNTKTNSWSQVEDHRGEEVFSQQNLSSLTISELGPIPSGYITVKPEPKNKYQIWQNGGYTYPDLATLKMIVKSDLDKAYETKLNVAYKVNNYYVLPCWATTYTSTLVAMQQDIAEDGTLDETYQVLLITNPIKSTTVQIQVTSIDEFMPYYNKVKAVYKELTEDYHSKIVAISSINNAEEIVKLILNY